MKMIVTLGVIVPTLPAASVSAASVPVP